MKIIADTNLFVRAITGDDERQSTLAKAELEAADLVAIPLPVLCELVWVLARGYGVGSVEIAQKIRQILNSARIAVNQPAALAGLAILEAGGDFADGVIAFEGAWLGGESFVSFDRQAVDLLSKRGVAARRL